MSEEPRCVAGCQSFYGGEVKHHPDCPYYQGSLSKMFDDRMGLLLKARDILGNGYRTFNGMKPVYCIGANEFEKLITAIDAALNKGGGE